MIATSTGDLSNLFFQVTQWNLAYLGICVAIIILSAGIIYIFNVKPLEKNLERQEKDIGDLKNQVTEKIAAIVKLEEKLDADEKRLAQAEFNDIDQTLNNIWTQHLLAQSTTNYGGNILALTWYLRIAQAFKRGNVKICLDQIKLVLDSDPGNYLSSVTGMIRWNPSIVITTYTDMINSLKTVEGFDALKEEIINKATQKWISPTNH
jgi:uncharacterized coiled-coil protein SlyX